MDKVKNLSIPQMAMILAGALILRKVLNTKVAIVGKNESSTDSVLPALIAETNSDLVKEFEPVQSAVILPIMGGQTLEIKTPFNSPELQIENNETSKFTNEYFK